MAEFQLYQILMCNTWLNSSRRTKQKLKTTNALKPIFTPEKGVKLKKMAEFQLYWILMCYTWLNPPKRGKTKKGTISILSNLNV